MSAQDSPDTLKERFAVTRPCGQVMVTHIDEKSGMGLKPSQGYIDLTPDEIDAAKEYGVPAFTR